MKDITNNTIKIILIAVLAIMLIAGIILISSCKGGDIVTDESAALEDDQDAGEMTEVEEANGDNNGEEQDVDTGSTVEKTEEGQTEEAVETEEIPTEITEEIETADNYFAEGMYAEAAKEYRDASRLIGDSSISEGLKEELLAQISQNHQDAENITETARMHHGNAMTLQYEKRFEEARAELEAALEIYPKYQTAADALDSLEALVGLE